MKTLCMIFFLLASVCCISQNFEGTMKWSMKSEITDPKLKAQMEEAQKKLNDPATQAEMKQMKEKMNSPEMKAMMDQNPQMKQQMEAAMSVTNDTIKQNVTPPPSLSQVANTPCMSKELQRVANRFFDLESYTLVLVEP